MGAETTVYVKVVKEIEEWVEVSAITLTGAKAIARNDIDVIRVLSGQYDKPEWEEQR